MPEGLLAEIEARAIDMARGAGAILSGHFRKSLEVEYKDEKQTDPVTNADNEAQDYLKKAIAGHFPDHGVLGEEDEEDDSPAPDFVWVLDPLDGTKNFVAGLPVYACSIGVLHRGVPVAGALYLPWPNHNGGIVLHARSGGGAFMDDEPISVLKTEEPSGTSLIALPGYFTAVYRLLKPMRGRVGELRVTGSIAYELAMVSMGVLQYSVTLRPHLWDVAGGAVLVTEAGGLLMRRSRSAGLGALVGATRWGPMDSLVTPWRTGETTLKELRRWSETMAYGSPGVVRYLTSNMRSRPRLRRRLTAALRRMRRRG